MRRFLSLLFGTSDQLVVIEAEDSLGYTLVRIPVVPDTADDLVALIDGER